MTDGVANTIKILDATSAVHLRTSVVTIAGNSK